MTDFNEVTKVTQIIQRADGSEVRIVATAMYGAGLHRSIDIYAHKRRSPEHEWDLLSDKPHPDWLTMSVDEYIRRGRSPLRQAVSPGELLKVASAIGLPISEFQGDTPDQVTVFSGYLKHDGARLQVDFHAPTTATQADLDSAFLSALSQQVDVDYGAIGTCTDDDPVLAERPRG